MHYAFKHLATAATLVQQYNGELPLAAFLKQYFSAHKKHGSKDRKYISELCYCYYRLGHALLHLPVEERMKIALYLCSNELQSWEALFEETWLQQHTPLLSQRISFVQQQYPALQAGTIFPWLTHCSETIDTTAFAYSHLVQPKVFLRIRPGYEQKVPDALAQQNIPFEQADKYCIALQPNTSISTLLDVNKAAVVQDYSSQKVGGLLQQVKVLSPGTQWRIWDCCAASGGKSILANDLLKPASLTVSDVRESIIRNLQQRFKEAGITRYDWFTADLTKQQKLLQNRDVNLVICDAPCSGSGTWGRTPEQLFYFTNEQLQHYASLQQQIVNNIVPQIKAGTYFLYITCSVFREENETMVQLLQQKHAMKILQTEVLKGYALQADSMFAALCIKE
ncbi:RsmB/NOP family class I SAM-dependent RNA methyltransferase [Deminuibacter soli]|nr:Fmu (Sun) domain-containing protein [Deminuibacter soli]